MDLSSGLSLTQSYFWGETVSARGERQIVKCSKDLQINKRVFPYFVDFSLRAAVNRKFPHILSS